MDINIIWLLVYTSINNIISANGFKIKTTMFRMHRSKQHDVRECAMEILSNDTIVGGHISDLSGKCETLTGPLNEQQTLETGYGYVEKINFKQVFQPPVSSSDGLQINFPRPPIMGSRVDFNFVRTPPASYTMQLRGHGIHSYRMFSLRVDENVPSCNLRVSSLTAGQNDINKQFPFEWQTLCPLDECRISFIVQDKQIQVFANDVKIQYDNVEVEWTFVRQLRQAIIYTSSSSTIKSFVFTI
ncbi:uncharacterized protein LOC132730206 [Ruditapes philippinarum]|uniref:uncharacterized protein LOC132730206 n=1 Tax=Ruditapes philippinarum TaxID=129788 RepID=UPI00295B75C5|nr:uncharacterized protein LOC132730206 [Ruditapes philippinarum]